MNNDVIKDPVQPGVTPQPANNNTALIIVIVVVVVMFILPMIAFFAFVTIVFKGLEGMNFGPDENYRIDYSVMTTEQVRTFKAIHLLSEMGTLKTSGISRQDCMNMRSAAEDYYYSVEDGVDDFQWLPDNYCKGDYANISVSIDEDSDNYKVYLYDVNTCIYYYISSDHTRLMEFVYDTRYCSNGEKVPIIDDGSLDDEDDEIEAPSVQAPSTPQTKTNAV